MQVPINPLTGLPIPMQPNARVYRHGRSLLDNIYGQSSDPLIQANPPSRFRTSMMGGYGLLNGQPVKRNFTSTDTSAFVDPNIFDPYLRNKIPPKPNVGPEYEPYLKWNGKEWIMDYPEELETPDTKVEGVSNQPNIEIANQRAGILDKGFSSQGEELANQGLLSAKDTKKETKKEKGLLDSLVDLAQTDFGRDFFMGMDTGYSKEPKSLMQSIQQGYNYAKQNELARDKLDIERLKANKMGGEQSFAYVVTDPNSGKVYNAFQDKKGSIFVNVDGKRVPYSPNMFGGDTPAYPSTVGNLGKSNVTGNEFWNIQAELDLEESSLRKMLDYLSVIEDMPMGMEKLSTQFGTAIKSILGDNNLSLKQLSTALADGSFQALVGANRLDVVGGGVMTEQDALRIISALGGDPTKLTTHPEIITRQISKIFSEKYKRYEKAIDRYNIEVTKGGFTRYPEREKINLDQFKGALDPIKAIELNLELISEMSLSQIQRLEKDLEKLSDKQREEVEKRLEELLG